jgi:hypothetical protein
MAISPAEPAHDAAKLTKALRLEDVLISAAAVPLPIDLSPSQLPQPNLDPTGASTDARDAHASAADAQAPASAVEPAHDAPAEDAVAKSLQAAHDAIHDSLSGTGDPTATVDSQPLDAAHLSADATADPVHAGAAGDIAALAPIAPGPAHALPQLDLPADMATLFPASAADGALANVVHDVQSVVGDLGAVIDGLLGPLATAVAPVTAAVADVAASAEHVVQSAVGLVLPADDETHAGANAQANTAAAPAAPPPQAEPEAVTVPSLHGVGTDALAGLLQPAPASIDATHDVAPTHLGVDDLALLHPIGLEDLAHSDQAAAHVAHALPPAGSGLI